MTTTTISPKFQIMIPKHVREKLHLYPHQPLHVAEKGGVITLVPEVPLKKPLRGYPRATFGKRKAVCEDCHGV